MDNLNFLSLLICNLSTATVRNLASIICHPFTYCSFSVHMYSSIRTVNLYLMGNNFVKVESLCSFFCLSFTDSTHFYSDLCQDLSSHTLQWGCFIYFITVKLFCHILHFIPGIPEPLKFFKNVYILRPTLCAVKFYGFWQTCSILYLPLS